MLIYKATNLINGKIYIGQTTLSLEERKSHHLRDSKRLDTYFYRAIQKYGWENFSWEVIEDNIDDIDVLDEREIYWINYYDTFDNPDKGYNTQSGGHHFKLTQQECKNRSERATGENNPMYGKPGTWKGKHFSEEHKKHLSESLSGKERPSVKGALNPAAKEIINLSTGEIFSTITEACKVYDISLTALGRHLNKKTDTCLGFKWDYTENVNLDEYVVPEHKT